MYASELLEGDEKLIMEALEACTRQDYITAFLIFKSLAESGNNEAKLCLGDIYTNGRIFPHRPTFFGAEEIYPTDYEKALYWYTRAAIGYENEIDEESVWPFNENMGAFRLSMMYFNGQGVPQDFKLSAYWGEKSGMP